MESSFVLTLKLDSPSFERLQALRSSHFPRAINWLPAHLTLLHALSLAQVLRLAAHRHHFERRMPFAMNYVALRFLGRGVAVNVEAPALPGLRSQVLETVGGEFTRQDLQPFRAHVTIQNKADAATAKSLHAELSQTFEPWAGRAEGLLVWRYLGGPWAPEAEYEFADATSMSSL